MWKIIYKILITAVLLMLGISGLTADSRDLSKLEYYNKVLVPKYNLNPLDPQVVNALYKPSGAESIRRTRLDVGNVATVISNKATLGYDRWKPCWQFPRGGSVTYRWTMGPLVAAVIDGKKRVADGTVGAVRSGCDEFMPLPGYHSGLNDEAGNIGIACSDITQSWPAAWPSDPIDQKFKIGEKGFKGAVDGELRATREMYFPVSDSDNVEGAMGVRVDIWGLQWNDFLNEDFIVFKMVVTNNSDKEWNDVYIGIHDDPDCPEQGSNEWMDDFAAFIPVGDPNFDTLLWNFSYLWDGDDQVGGLFSSGVGWVGLKVLETPIDPQSGQEKGLTTLQVFPYELAPKNEDDAYDQMAAGILPATNVQPHPEDWTQTPNTYGPDITYVVATGPFNLKPGESINFAFASVHGTNKADLFNNAQLCQMLYNNNYQSAESPPVPDVKAFVDQGKVVLYWDDRAERGIYYKKDANGTITGIDHEYDALTGTNAFEGYKVYRSDDGGVTWGDLIRDMDGVPRGYIPLAVYDLKNGIKGESSMRKFFNLGTDAGLKHYYVDQNVGNGYEYLYAVVAYDHEDGVIAPLENAIPADPYVPGDNLVAIRPHGKPSGIVKGSADTVALHTAGNCDLAEQQILMMDPDRTTGQTYEIGFATDDETGDMLFNVKIAGSDTYAKTDAGFEVKNWPFYDQDSDNAPIFDGIKPIIANVEPDFKSYTWSGSSTAQIYFDGIYDVYVPDVYELTWDTTAVANVGPFGSPGVPFTIFNKTRNTPCLHHLFDSNENGQFDALEDVLIIENDETFGNIFLMYFPSGTVMPSQGEICTIVTNKIITADDKYQFTTVKKNLSTITESNLKDITVVPNPYVVTSRYESGMYGSEKVIQFHYLPPKCT
nr:hypothetical protein [Candidatus Delongbacteria bacterium]